MAKLSLGQKANRVLRFLLGLRNPYIVALLKPYGFGAADLEEGWTLLRALGKGRMDADPEEIEYDAVTLRQLDDWENRWFVIASATLQRHAPGVHRWFFKNLAQTEGPDVIVSTGTFVERWGLLDKAAKMGGPPAGGKAAKKKLLERGLTTDVIQEAKKLIAALGAVKGPVPDLGAKKQSEDDLESAEKAMWAWYLEWSEVARTAIKRRSYLRQLGFLATPRGDAADEEDAGEAGGEEADQGPEEAGDGAPEEVTEPAAPPPKKGKKPT